MSRIAQLRKQRLTESKRDRAVRDLRYLAVDILGYDWCSGPWHRQVFSFIDENRHKPRVAVFSPRFSYKSRIQCAEIIQEIIRDPDTSIALVHHKLDLARELVIEIGELFQKNDDLRALLPASNRSSKNYHQFIKSSQGGSFTLKGTSRSKATLQGFSADQDLTGAHPSGPIFLDDIISAKTVEYFNGVAGLRNWIRHTIIPLAGAAGRLRVKGTMWSPDDWYNDIMDSDQWDWICKSILEDKDGNPDEANGEPIEIYVGDSQADGGKRMLTMEDVQRYKEEMKSHFAGQMMNDPRPDGSLPWNMDRCENYVSRGALAKLVQKIVILTDPAPLGMDIQGRLVKPDGTKDYWANAVIGYIRSQRRTIRVLLDGSMSQQWGLDEGLMEIKRLMRKWRVKIVGIEEPLGAGSIGFYSRSLKDKFKERDVIRGYRVMPVKFKSTQKGKPPRIMDLAAMAGMRDMEGESDPLFMMCAETCDPAFLEMFLTQARNWSGKDTLEHDDCLDVVAYSDDPALMEVVRLGTPITDIMSEMKSQTAPPPRRTRHCPA